MFVCERCNRSYKYLRNMKAHQKYECGKEPTLICFECGYKAKLKSRLKQHLRMMHKIEYVW